MRSTRVENRRRHARRRSLKHARTPRRSDSRTCGSSRGASGAWTGLALLDRPDDHSLRRADSGQHLPRRSHRRRPRELRGYGAPSGSVRRWNRGIAVLRVPLIRPRGRHTGAGGGPATLPDGLDALAGNCRPELAARTTSAIGHRFGWRVVRHLEPPALVRIEPGPAALDALKDACGGGSRRAWLVCACCREHQFHLMIDRPQNHVVGGFPYRPELVHSLQYSASLLPDPPGPSPSLLACRTVCDIPASATMAASGRGVECLWKVWIRWRTRPIELPPPVDDPEPVCIEQAFVRHLGAEHPLLPDQVVEDGLRHTRRGRPLAHGIRQSIAPAPAPKASAAATAAAAMHRSSCLRRSTGPASLGNGAPFFGGLIRIVRRPGLDAHCSAA